MAPTLYMIPPSPPVRAVRMTAKALNVDLELKSIDLFGGEHLQHDFLKLNPAHTLPTMVDDDFVLWDSHAIMTYLVGKYGKDDSLYPKDLRRRAIVDQLLHFDGTVVFSKLRLVGKPIFYDGIKEIPEANIALVNDAYKTLDVIIGDKDFVAGNTPTLADLSLITSISSLNYLIPVDEKFTSILAWMKRMEKLPYHDINKKGLEIFEQIIKSKIG